MKPQIRTLLTSALLVGSLSACTGITAEELKSAAYLATDVALLYVQDDGTGAVLQVDVPRKDCEEVAEELNEFAGRDEENAIYKCVPVAEEVEQGPLTEPEIEVIVQD